MSTAHVPAPVSRPQPDPNPPARGRSPSLGWGRLLWGLALLGAGALWLLDAGDIIDVTYPTVIALALIGLGVVVPFVPAKQHGGVIGLGLALTVLAFVTVVAGPAVDPTLLRRGAGNVSVAPASVEQLRQHYEHGAGDFTIDLRRVVFPAGVTRTSVHLGAGELQVRLPDDVSVRVHASAGLGEVAVLTQKRSGVAPTFDSEVRGSSTERILDLEAAVGVGSIEVTR